MMDLEFKLIGSNQLQEEFKSFPEIYPTPSFWWTKEEIINAAQAGIAWGVWDQSKLAGLAIYNVINPEAEIILTYVVPEAREKGLMTQLLNHIFKTEVSIAKWLLEVHPANLAGLRTYESLGFHPLSIRPNYYRDGANALVLSRP